MNTDPESHLNLPERIHYNAWQMHMIKLGFTNPGWMFPVGYKKDPYRPLIGIRYKKKQP